jgi:eukaryotic-like serine/threonine-protein kinase
MIGTTVTHYRIVSKLGEGGMGVVYEAEDLTLGRRVALKFCLSGRDDAKLRANLLKEARAASSLSHPNIAHIYEFVEDPAATRSSPWSWCPAPICGASSASGA